MAQYTRDQPYDRVNHNERRKFAAGQDIIAYRYLLIRQFADPLVNAFIVAAYKDEPLLFSYPFSGFLIELVVLLNVGLDPSVVTDFQMLATAS